MHLHMEMYVDKLMLLCMRDAAAVPSWVHPCQTFQAAKRHMLLKQGGDHEEAPPSSPSSKSFL